MIEITYDPLLPDSIVEKVRVDAGGAVVTFLGTTRLYTDGKRVLYLEYEAYRPMADRMLEETVKEISSRWDICSLAIAHRLGRLEIGEISLVIAVSAPHRREAFEACQYAVDRIKQAVPIWKKEFFENSVARWVEAASQSI